VEEHQIFTQINPIGSIYFGSSEFDAFSRMLAIGFAPLLPKGIQPKLDEKGVLTRKLVFCLSLSRRGHYLSYPLITTKTGDKGFSGI